MLARAEGMHYYTPEGREILDGTSGLWCCNAGHGRREIVEAIQKQAAIMDFAPAFQLGHPIAFEAASRVADMTPDAFTHMLCVEAAQVFEPITVAPSAQWSGSQVLRAMAV